MNVQPTLFVALVILGGCRGPMGAPAANTPISPASATPGPASPYVLVLGTAQDAGAPQIACHDRCCERIRRDGRHRRFASSILLVDPVTGQRWLFDATPDLREQVELCRGRPPQRVSEGYRPALFEGIFLTHAHMGHYAGLIHLGPEAYSTPPLPTHVSSRMAEFLRKNGPWSLLVDRGHLELAVFTSNVPIQLTESLRVTPVPVPHREEFSDTHAFIIEGPQCALLYLPDIDKWERYEPGVETLLSQVDYALLDGSFFGEGEIPGRSLEEIPHPFICESIERFSGLSGADRAKIWFTHLNHTNPVLDPGSAERRQVTSHEMAVCEQGSVFEL